MYAISHLLFKYKRIPKNTDVIRIQEKRIQENSMDIVFTWGHVTNISSGFHKHSGLEVYLVLEQYEYFSK